MPEVLVGVIMLDTAFARLPGDLGNPAGLPFACRYAVVPGATARRAVEGRADGLLEPFAAAGRELVRAGCELITTSCGFLACHQRPLAAALAPATFVSSALLVLPSLLATLPPDARIGVVTANASALGAAHLDGAGVPAGARRRLVPIGLEHTAHLYPALMGDAPGPDAALAEPEVVAAVTAAVASDPSIRLLVCECTNLPPYRPALAAATGLEVVDIVTVLTALQTPAAGRG
jgi:hypothetical protein